MKKVSFAVTALLSLSLDGFAQNTFPGTGNVGIGTSSPNSLLTLQKNNTGVSIDPVGTPYFGTLGFNREVMTGAIFDPTGNAFQINNGGLDKNLHVQVYNGLGAPITRDALVISGSSGFIGIGTPSPDAQLSVKGTVHAQEVKVDLNVPGPDYVFYKTYALRPLTELEKFVVINKHLPEIPSAKSMATEGISVGQMDIKLLKKIEELTLYLLEKERQYKELKQMVARNDRNQRRLISNLEKRLAKHAEYRTNLYK